MPLTWFEKNTAIINSFCDTLKLSLVFVRELRDPSSCDFVLERSKSLIRFLSFFSDIKWGCYYIRNRVHVKIMDWILVQSHHLFQSIPSRFHIFLDAYGEVCWKRHELQISYLGNIRIFNFMFDFIRKRRFILIKRAIVDMILRSPPI